MKSALYRSFVAYVPNGLSFNKGERLMVPEPAKKNVSALQARFYKSGKKDMIAISIAGDGGTEAHAKVTPKEVAQFPREWDAYQLGQDVPKPMGTPLTEL